MSKEELLRQALMALKNNKGIEFKITAIDTEGLFFGVNLTYTTKSNKLKTTHFGFVEKWFDPDYFGLPYVRTLKLPDNLSPDQKVILKIAYYFYRFYNKNQE